MTLKTSFEFVPSYGSFLILIAPADFISEALSRMLASYRGLILYLSGNYPVFLSGIKKYEDRFEVRRALTAYQILTILEESHHSCILLEHDRSLYDDNSDLLIPIGKRCREQAALTGAVFLFASRPDMYLNQIEPFAHRLRYYLSENAPIATSRKKRSGIQVTLDRGW